MSITNAIKLSTTFVIMENAPQNGKLKDRLAWARERLGLTQAELATKSKIAQSTIASWETGARETGRKIATLAEHLGVDPLWLAEGLGSPTRALREAQPDDAQPLGGLPKKLEALVFYEQLTKRQALLLHKFEMLSEDGKQHVEAAADFGERAGLTIVDDQSDSGTFGKSRS